MTSVDTSHLNYDRRAEIRLAYSVAFVPEERRSSARIEHSVTTHLIKWENLHQANRVDVQIEDFSATGVGATCKTPLAIGGEYLLHIPLARRDDLRVILVVRRCEANPDGGYRVGMEMTDLLDHGYATRLATSIRGQRRQLRSRRVLWLFMLFGIVGIMTSLLLS